MIYVGVGIILFLIISLPVIGFTSNLSAQLVIQNDCAQVAAQVAGIVDDYRYWLDRPRPGFDSSKAIGIAKSAGEAMCDRLGMKANNIDIRLETDAAGNERTVCRLQVDARRRYPLRADVMGYNLAAYFPGILTVEGETRHGAGAPYSLIHLDAPTTADESNKRPLGFNQRDVAVIPAYGFFYDAVAGSRAPGTSYGKGIANMAPENFMAMNHYHLKKSDIEHTLTTGEDVFNNSWHPERAYSGRPTTMAFR